MTARDDELMTCHRNFLASIVLVQVQDARKGDCEAMEWLDSPYCNELISWLDLDGDAFSQQVRKITDNSKRRLEE